VISDCTRSGCAANSTNSSGSSEAFGARSRFGAGVGVAGDGVGVVGFGDGDALGDGDDLGVEGFGETNGFFAGDAEEVDDFFFGRGVAAKPAAPKASTPRSVAMEVKRIFID